MAATGSGDVHVKRMTVLPFAVLIGSGATSQPVRDPPPTYECVRKSTAIVVDGALDDAAWKRAPWTADFVDIVGTHDRPAPALRTRAKLLWDADHLYIAAEVIDPRVAATIRRRDEQLFREQVFEVFIDPGADGKDYLEIQINPLNTICDLAMNKPYREGGKANVAFDLIGLRTAVRVDGTVNDPSDIDEGWNVELAIPWAAMKLLSDDMVAPPREGERWRVNYARMRPAEAGQDEQAKVRGMWVWSAQGAVNMHLPERWGWVRFVAANDGAPKR